MMHSFAHITETTHTENTNIFHWLLTNPSAAIAAILCIGTLSIIVSSIIKKHRAKTDQ